jgi:hypothetical protein
LIHLSKIQELRALSDDYKNQYLLAQFSNTGLCFQGSKLKIISPLSSIYHVVSALPENDLNIQTQRGQRNYTYSSLAEPSSVDGVMVKDFYGPETDGQESIK